MFLVRCRLFTFLVTMLICVGLYACSLKVDRSKADVRISETGTNLSTSKSTTPGSTPSIQPTVSVPAMKSECLGHINEKQQVRSMALKEICSKLKGGHANLLIFGTGWDSPFWLESNPHGTTYFMEHHGAWIVKQPQAVKDRVFIVKYSTHFAKWKEEIENQGLLKEFFETQVPEELKHIAWDVIFVDSPEGVPGPHNPGRGQSVYAAAKLAGPSTTVFVDDCERPSERSFAQRYLAKEGDTLIEFDGGPRDERAFRRDSVCEFPPLARRDPPL